MQLKWGYMLRKLPTIHSDRNGFEELVRLAEGANALFNEPVEIDFSRCSFFAAHMAAPLAVVLAHFAAGFNRVTITKVPPAVEGILQKNGFLHSYGYRPLDDKHGTVLPFRRLRLSDEGLFGDYLDQHLRGKGIPQMSPALAKAFKQSIFEVFQNAATHSRSQRGVYVCGQFFPHKKRLDLTIADAGVGIETPVREYLRQPTLSSVEAIRWALQKGHTTRTGPYPGGLGLKLLKDFIVQNRGRIQIVSRRGFYELRGGDDAHDHFQDLRGDFCGTAVNLEVNTADNSAYCLQSEAAAVGIF